MKVLLITLLTLLSLNVRSQIQNITLNEYLINAREAPPIQRHRNYQSTIENSRFNLPIVKEIEFRTQTDEFLLFQQQYAIRVSTIPIGKIRNAHKVGYSLKQNQLLQHELVLHELLKDRYITASNYYLLNKKIQFLQRYRDFLERKLKYYKEEVNTLSDFDIKDLISAREEYIRVRKDFEKYSYEIKDLEEYIQIQDQYRDKVNLVLPNFILLNQIDSIITTGFDTSLSNHPLIKNSKSEADLALSEYSYERSETRPYFSFLQASYAYKNNELKENLRLGFGVAFPLPGSNIINKNEKLFESIIREEEYQNLKYELYLEREKLESEIQSMINLQDTTQEEYSLKNLLLTPVTDSYTKLKVEDGILKEEEYYLDLYEETILLFIEWLDVSGKLSEKPFRNYLSQSLDKLE